MKMFVVPDHRMQSHAEWLATLPENVGEMDYEQLPHVGELIDRFRNEDKPNCEDPEWVNDWIDTYILNNKEVLKALS